jgi:hypothetical protein
VTSSLVTTRSPAWPDAAVAHTHRASTAAAVSRHRADPHRQRQIRVVERGPRAPGMAHSAMRDAGVIEESAIASGGPVEIPGRASGIDVAHGVGRTRGNSMDTVDQDQIALDLHCCQCGGPIAVHAGGWPPGDHVRQIRFSCPWCGSVNRAGLPARVALVVRRSTTVRA